MGWGNVSSRLGTSWIFVRNKALGLGPSPPFQGISADADAATEAVGVIAVSLQVGNAAASDAKNPSVAKGEKKRFIVEC